jgi:hypothetical protein
MEMTNSEALRAVIDSMASDGMGRSPEQINTVLLTSIANSLAVIADALTDREVKKESKE